MDIVWCTKYEHLQSLGMDLSVDSPLHVIDD
jgi:hypothetical protein